MSPLTPHDVDLDESDGPDGVDRDDFTAAETIHFRDMTPALEFACWAVVALAPFLRWVNGAAVTNDQFYIQCAIVAFAVVGAVGLRLYNWRAGQSQRE